MWTPPLTVQVAGLVNVPLGTHWVAQAVTNSTDATNLFTTLSSVGVTGVFAYLLATARLVPKSTYDVAVKDAAESRDRELTLYRDIMRGVVPAMRDTVQAVERVRYGGE